MNRCYLGLGSNQQGPQRQIRRAFKHIKALPSTVITKQSTLYWTPAWGNTRQQNFCNAVVEIQTFLSPTALLAYCNKIEQKQGRVRKKKYGPRSLDVDILLYANRQLKSKKLTVPHPQIQNRNFVLIPLLEINPSISWTY